MIYTYQKKLKGEKIGVVFGTFVPLHQGHLDLIMRAKKECDGGCIVLVDGRDGDRGGKEMPLKLRYRYVREFFADDDLVAVYPIDETELVTINYPNEWTRYITSEDSYNNPDDFLLNKGWIKVLTGDPAHIYYDRYVTDEALNKLIEVENKKARVSNG